MIFGIFSLKPGGGPSVRSVVERAGGGSFVSPGIGLKSAGPEASFFSDRATKRHIVWRGEIYNRLELRRELEKAGCLFASDLDSELALRAYGLWGAGCQEKFNGEWSFAVWDENERRLFCSRDRFGLKPFYYYFDGNSFVFGSSIKALFAAPFIERAPNDRAVFDYLVLNRENQPGETFFKDIRQLEAGCCLSLIPRAKPVLKRYYDPACNIELGKFDKKALKKYAAEFLKLLESAVKLRMVPPFPAGSMLSGGMDSSSIVCLANRIFERSGDKSGPGKLKVFSILWKNEAKFIKEVSRAMVFPHYRIKPEEVGKISWGDVERAVLSSERPVNITPFFGGIKIRKKAEAEKVKVLFDGGGGDELLAGYPEKYFNVYLSQILCGGDLPGFMKEFKALYAGRLEEFTGGKKLSRDFYKTFLRTQSSAPQLSDLLARKTVAPGFLRKYGRRKAQLARGPDLNLQKALRRDTLRLGNEYYPPASVIYRRPFLDHRLAEYVFSLPACYKLHNGWTKYLLRAAMEGILPAKVCWRRQKVGGTIPGSIWKDFLRKNKARLKAVLSGPEFRSAAFLNQAEIVKNFEGLFAAAVAPETTDISGLWRFVNLELWLRHNMRPAK